MEFAHLKQLDKRKKADVLVLPFWKDKQGAQLAGSLEGEFSSLLTTVLATEDFKGKEGETLYLYVEGLPETRICLLGLGAKEKLTVESLRRSYGSLTKSCLAKRLKDLNLFIPRQDKLSEENLLTGMAEGLLLANYAFNRFKHRDPEEPEEILVQKVTWIGPQPKVLNIAKKVLAICEAVYYARDLINGNADEVTPQYLAECAKNLAKKHPAIKATIFDKKRIEKEKMGLLLAVNRGSTRDPAFIIMEYKGNSDSRDHTILVGKGITYDTGGLNLKPTGGMETMKCDMSGGAACMGTILAVCLLGLEVNLTIVVPTTENCIDANSFKPGDVHTSYSGKTVEVTNTDAEGRLILADALAYAVKNLNPTRLIDLATLTGAIEIALGSEAAGVMSTHDELAQALLESGEATFERLWRMPLFDEYKERLKSDIADLKSWNGRPAGANVAATFLRQFVDEAIPWAHIDIAGTAYLSEAKKYLPKHGIGFGIRLMVHFLEKLANQKEEKLGKEKRSKRIQPANQNKFGVR
jgi:leucyl aminopeptidase